MSEPFIAEVKMFGGIFAPRGYAFCNGQILSIAQNTALFSLVGTTSGGGWFLEQPAMARPAKPMLRLRSDSLGRSWYVPLDTVVQRDDLVAAFGPDTARSGGFNVTLPLASLPPGRYELMLVDQTGEAPALCRPPGKSVMVH